MGNAFVQDEETINIGVLKSDLDGVRVPWGGRVNIHGNTRRALQSPPSAGICLPCGFVEMGSWAGVMRLWACIKQSKRYCTRTLGAYRYSDPLLRQWHAPPVKEMSYSFMVERAQRFTVAYNAAGISHGIPPEKRNTWVLFDIHSTGGCGRASVGSVGYPQANNRYQSSVDGPLLNRYEFDVQGKKQTELYQSL